MLKPQEILDVTLQTSELPLHQAIISGDENRALQIIDSFQNYEIDFAGQIIGEFTFDGPRKILSKNSLGETLESRIQQVLVVNRQNGEYSGFDSPPPLDPELYYKLHNNSVSIGMIPDGIYSSGWLREMGPNHTQTLYINGFDIRKLDNQNKFRISLGENENLLYVLDKSKPGNIFHRNKEHLQNAIHLAAEKGMTKVVEKLLEKGIPVDMVDGIGKTAVHYAAMKQKKEVLELLKQKGANMSKADDLGQRPIDQFTSENNQNFGVDIVSLLGANDPLDVTIKSSQPNNLHKSISGFDSAEKLKKIKEIARYNPKLVIRNQDGFLPSELVAKGKSNPTKPENHLKKYLEFREKIYSLSSEYTKNSAIFRNISGDQVRDSDIAYLDLLTKGLLLIEEYAKTSTGFKNNYDAVIDALNLISTISIHVSYDLREVTYDKIPWQNIEYLRYLITQDHIVESGGKKTNLNKTILENCLSNFTEIETPALRNALSNIKSQLEQERSKGIKIEEKKDNLYKSQNTTSSKRYIDGYEGIYQMSDPIADLRYLQRIFELCENIEKFNLATENGRRAMLASLQQICELAKFSHGSRKLSDAIKSEFDNVPWEELAELRDYLSHYIEIERLPKELRDNIRSNVMALISGGKDKLEEILEPIKHLKEQAGLVIKKQEQRLLDQKETEEFYKNSGIKISDAQKQDDLIRDISLSLGLSEIKSSVKKKEGSIKFIKDDVSKEEKQKELDSLKAELLNLEQRKEKFENLIKNHKISEDLQREILSLLNGKDRNKLDIKTKWTDEFKQIKNAGLTQYSEYSKLSEFKTSLETETVVPPTTSPSADRYKVGLDICRKAVETIDKLGIILAGSEENYKRYCEEGREISRIDKLSIYPARMSQESLEKFLNDPEMQKTADHLVLDIEQYLNTLNSRHKKDFGNQLDSNKGFRNFIAHKHLSSDTIYPNEKIAKTMETATLLDYVIEIHGQLKDSIISLEEKKVESNRSTFRLLPFSEELSI